MEVLFLIMFFVLGACFGSFVNMAVYRVAVKYGLRLPLRQLADRNDGKRSFCDYCGRQLGWFENIPIISWFLQKGKTRCCEKRLPVTYPIVELLMGTLFVIYEIRFMPCLPAGRIYESNILAWVLGLVIIVLLVFSAVFDFKYMILPDFSTIILILIALIGVIFDEKNMVPYLLSAVAAAGFLLLLHVITRGKGMGMGDVKYALFMGLFLGSEKIVMAFYVAFITGAVVGLILIIVGKMGRKSIISFGPFLIWGTFIAWWWGNEISAIILKVLE